MTAPFVGRIRARSDAVRLHAAGATGITIRVEIPELWDAVRIECPATEPVLAIKQCALHELLPLVQYHEDFVLKLHGWEILNEHETLASVGAIDGSILLLTHRRRRPLR